MRQGNNGIYFVHIHRIAKTVTKMAAVVVGFAGENDKQTTG